MLRGRGEFLCSALTVALPKDWSPSCSPLLSCRSWAEGDCDQPLPSRLRPAQGHLLSIAQRPSLSSLNLPASCSPWVSVWGAHRAPPVCCILHGWGSQQLRRRPWAPLGLGQPELQPLSWIGRGLQGCGGGANYQGSGPWQHPDQAHPRGSLCAMRAWLATLPTAFALVLREACHRSSCGHKKAGWGAGWCLSAHWQRWDPRDPELPL